MRLEPLICRFRGHKWRFWLAGPPTDRCLRCYATRPHKPTGLTGLTGGSTLWGTPNPPRDNP